MRAWTKSACVVLAWSILSIILVMVGMRGPIRPAPASARTASSTTEVRRAGTLTASVMPVAATDRPRYVVQDGDTLSSIATRFALRGGWPALYAANRQAIGPDPNLIRAGTVLLLPAGVLSRRYTVAAGDTLSAIAAEFAVRGGWPALYAANRRAIGPNPDAVRVGTVLRIPGLARPSPSRSPRPRAGTPHPAPAPSRTTAPRHPKVPAASRAARAAGMPSWLKLAMLSVGLLVLAAFLAEVVVVAARRRRQAGARAMRRALAGASPAPALEAPGPGGPRILFADHDQLVITRDPYDDTICVLRPPDQDPRAILQVARLVLPERRYADLAEQLGLPARWPME
jgi:LysM repeat protein